MAEYVQVPPWVLFVALLSIGGIAFRLAWMRLNGHSKKIAEISGSVSQTIAACPTRDEMMQMKAELRADLARLEGKIDSFILGRER